MSSRAWMDELGELTGEQLHQLDEMLAECRELAAIAAVCSSLADGLAAQQTDLLVELGELHHDVSMQQARVTVPMREAQAIVWRARFARNHPVPVTSH